MAWSFNTAPGIARVWDMWGSASNDIWAAAFGSGFVYHWDGASWNDTATLTGEVGTAIWGFATNDIWVGGDTGLLSHWDGASWGGYVVPSGGWDGSGILGMWGAASNDIWIVSQFGVVAHYDGASWTVTANLGGTFNWGIYGFASNDVWVGSDIGFSHWDGASWTTTGLPVGMGGVNKMFGVAANDLWAVGGDTGAGGHAVISHWDGASWTKVYDNVAVGEVRGVWGAASNDIWVGSVFPTGGPCKFLHWDGASFTVADTSSHEIWCMWGAAFDDIWAGGGVDSEGALYRYSVADPGTVSVHSVTCHPFSIAVVLTKPGVLTGDSLDPTKWIVEAPTPGSAVTVQAVSISGPTITLTTTEATNFFGYTLVVPQGVLRLSNSTPLLPSFSWNFTGVGEAPRAFMAQVIDTNHVRVIYSEPVVAAGALDTANYSVDPALEVESVVQESSTSYLLTTSDQTPDVLYTVTISNIQDLAGNIA